MRGKVAKELRRQMKGTPVMTVRMPQGSFSIVRREKVMGSDGKKRTMLIRKRVMPEFVEKYVNHARNAKRQYKKNPAAGIDGAIRATNRLIIQNEMSGKYRFG